MKELLSKLKDIEEIEDRKVSYIVKYLFDKILEVHESGYTMKQIYDRLAENGYKGKKTTFEYYYYSIKKRIKNKPPSKPKPKSEKEIKLSKFEELERESKLKKLETR